MGYVLANEGIENVVVVGCGGTGGFVAEGLARLLPQNIGLHLVDYDRVEPHNLLRQAFYREELGRFKSEVLATRLAKDFGKEVGYAVIPFDPSMVSGGYPRRFKLLVIGCVDNATARQHIASTFNSPYQGWWIDSGNDFNSGQVLIGNLSATSNYENILDPASEVCYALPSPVVQRPDLLTAVPERVSADVDCAEAIELGEQSAVINQIMSSLVLEFVRKLLTNQLSWMQVYVDMEVGQITPTSIDPKHVARLLGTRQNVILGKTVRQTQYCQNCGRVHS